MPQKTILDPAEEPKFMQWYQAHAAEAGIDPNPDSPEQKYDYRGAYKAGANPSINPSDGQLHWPSEFKALDHPNRFVDGEDTITGKPYGIEQDRLARLNEIQANGPHQAQVEIPAPSAADPYDIRSRGLNDQASALEAEAAPTPGPEGLGGKILSGIRAGAEGFVGGYTGGPGHFERQASRDAQERQRQQDLFTRAKQARGEGQDQQQMGMAASGAQAQQAHNAATLEETRRLRDLQEIKQNRDFVIQDRPKPGPVMNPGDTATVQSPVTGETTKGLSIPPKAVPDKNIGNFVGADGQHTEIFEPEDGKRYTEKFGTVRESAAQGTAAAWANVALSPDAMDKEARAYNITRTLPAGFTRRPDLLQGIISRAAELDPNAALASNKATYDGSKAKLATLLRMDGMIRSFEGTALANINLMLDSAKSIVDTGSPVLNYTLRQLSGATGSVEQAVFAAASRVATNEIARVVNTAAANGVLSDSSRKEFETILSPSATLGQIIGTVNILKQDMENRKISHREQIEETQNVMRVTEQGTSAAPATGFIKPGGALEKLMGGPKP